MGLLLPHGRCGWRDGTAFELTACPPGDGWHQGGALTDRIALGLGLFIVALIGADMLFNDSNALMFLLKKFADMVEWMAFWR
jgi:hypothetical protein